MRKVYCKNCSSEPLLIAMIVMGMVLTIGIIIGFIVWIVLLIIGHKVG